MPANVLKLTASMCSIILPIRTSRHAEKYSFRNADSYDFRNAGNYNWSKYLPLLIFPEMLAITIAKNIGRYNLP